MGASMCYALANRGAGAPICLPRFFTLLLIGTDRHSTATFDCAELWRLRLVARAARILAGVEIYGKFWADDCLPDRAEAAAAAESL
eukprot:SAG22_NODE_21484_length_256_cov_1.312102_1_plen_85_part_11